MGEKFDVFSIGRSPLCIDIITKLKGMEFKDAFENALFKEIENTKVRYLHLSDLVASKKAGAFTDNETKINFNGTAAILDKLTSTTLSFTISTSFNGVSYENKITLRH